MTKLLNREELFTEFDIWVNLNPELDSHLQKLTVGNVDKFFLSILWHDCLVLLLEVKTHGIESFDKSQITAINIIDAIFKLADGQEIFIGSWGWRKVKYLGFHKLVLENTNPDNSQWMKWDGNYIGINTLIELLRFDEYKNNE